MSADNLPISGLMIGTVQFSVSYGLWNKAQTATQDEVNNTLKQVADNVETYKNAKD